MRRAAIESQNQAMLTRQRQFRVAADVITDAWMVFPEVAAVAVIGSVAKVLWKEIPRFSDFRRARIEVWHECKDLDLALWIESQDRLGELRRTQDRALQAAYKSGADTSVVGQQVDTFLFEPETNRYLGRLCHYGTCPKDKPACRVEGCGEIPFNKHFPLFKPYPDILAPAGYALLYQRGAGRLRSALNLPTVAP